MKIKHIRILVYTWLLAFVLISGCKKEPELPANYMSFGGTTYIIGSVYSEDYGSFDTLYHDFDLNILSEGLSYNDTLFDYVGTGSYLYLDINSATLNEISPGIYEWNTTRGPNTLFFGYIGTNCTDGIFCETDTPFTGGKIEIGRDGNTYTLDFNFTTMDGPVTGRFSGSIIPI